jgi:hypothetical protein
MKTTLLLFVVLVSMNAVAAEPPSLWRQDGKPSADTDSMKSKDGFGAQLFLIEDKEFFDNWNKPETPHLTPVVEARRNVPVYSVIIFAEPGIDKDGKAKVTCHVTARTPDGKVYGEGDLNGWEDKYTVGSHALQLINGRMAIRIETDDPAGTYTVEATIRDKEKKVELPLKMTFKVAK